MKATLRHVCLSTAFAALLGTACTGQTAPPGFVTVGIVYRGGPAPGNSNALHAGTIRVLRTDGSLVAKRRVGNGRTFTATVPPGTYRIAAVSGDAGCAPREVGVRSGNEVVTQVICSVK